MRALLAASLSLLIAGCGEDLDAVMWDCQLAVQSENAGKSPEAAEERAEAIEACMDSRGYRLDAGSAPASPARSRRPVTGTSRQGGRRPRRPAVSAYSGRRVYGSSESEVCR